MKRGSTHTCLLPLLCACVLFSACSSEVPTQLESIVESGKLRVVTRNSPTTYFIGKNDKTGFEYEMARDFAEYLGLELEIVLARNTAEIIDIIENGEADLAAAGLSSRSYPQKSLMFGSAYQWVTRQVIYRNGKRRPTSLADIYPAKLHIAAGTLQPAQLTQLKKKYPGLSWQIHEDKDSHELLELIEHGDIPYTLAMSNELAHARQYNPEIRAAFNLSLPLPLAWAMKKNDDHSFLTTVKRFHASISKNGELADLIDKFYGPYEFFDYVDSRKFVDRYEQRLPELRPLFEQAARTYHFDWRLLAAVSYQESHWKSDARSPTGVRGLMMLTRITAKHVGVSNRLDPNQSIQGGAKYLTELINRIPDRISEPDRTWFALAAYNVGFGHMEDARILTQKRGANPDAWEDVRESLPLLSYRSWYKQTRYGYARGYEPVKYVKKIRKYYEMLIQLSQPTPILVKDGTDSEDYLLVEFPLIDSPVL